MKKDFRVEIMGLYSSYSGREITYYEVANKLELLDADDYSSSGFWCSLGGFTITLEGYKTIFRSFAFYNMVKATSFLLNSIYWLKGIHSDWFNSHEDVSELSIEFGMEEIMVVKKIEREKISLSYYKKNILYQPERGDMFFRDILMNIQEWINACEIALQEYFTVLLQVVRNEPNDNAARLIKEYYDVWVKIRQV